MRLLHWRTQGFWPTFAYAGIDVSLVTMEKRWTDVEERGLAHPKLAARDRCSTS